MGGGPHTQPQPRGLTSSPHLCLARREILASWLGEDTAAQRVSVHVCEASAREGLSIRHPLGSAPHLPLLRDSPRVSEKSRCPRLTLHLQDFLPLDGPGSFPSYSGWEQGVIWPPRQWLRTPRGHRRQWNSRPGGTASLEQGGGGLRKGSLRGGRAAPETERPPQNKTA